MYAELGITRAGYIDRDCVCLAQGDKDIIQAAVIFDVDGSKIQKYDLCMPELLEIERSGVYRI